MNVLHNLFDISEFMDCILTQVKHEIESDDEYPSPPQQKSVKLQALPSKWTDHEIKLLCDLKADNIPWPYIPFISPVENRTISKYFPGRNIKTIQNVWSKKRDTYQETFTLEKVSFEFMKC